MSWDWIREGATTWPAFLMDVNLDMDMGLSGKEMNYAEQFCV